MLSEAQQNQLSQQLMTMRIIAGALCIGVAVFAVIVLALKPSEAEEPFLAFLALLVSVACVVAAALLPRMVARSGRHVSADGPAGQPPAASRSDANQVELVTRAMAVHQTRLIVSLAILEGAAFFNLVAYMIEGQLVSVAVAFVLWVLMLVQFPSRPRTEGWVADEVRNARGGGR
jgi:hypothetical protein